MFVVVAPEAIAVLRVRSSVEVTTLAFTHAFVTRVSSVIVNDS